MELDPHEQRVLGCLIEKRRTTPDGYPLSLNALRLACNQATNRDPVMDLTDDQVRDAATGLHGHGLVRIAAAGQGSRTTKYRHVAEEGLPASDEELALLSVLLVRGPQTRGELRTRSERIHTFGSLDEVQDTLDGLGMRGLVELMDREPGAREARYRHQLGHHDPEVEAAAQEAAAAHRQQLLAEGRLPSSDEDDAGAAADSGLGTPGFDEASALPTTAASAPQPGPPAPPTPAPVAAQPGVDVAALIARIEALEQRVDELEELVAG
ncbi:MAG: YceH family protein [Solirubrobacteraceae bacterium]|nr:YceH family protein [Patulibacter sp.]